MKLYDTTPTDMLNRSFVVGDRVARARNADRTAYLEIEQVTKILGERIYTNDSKVPVKYPGRLLIITPIMPETKQAEPDFQDHPVMKRIIKTVTEQLGYTAVPITPEARFVIDVGCDSLDLIVLTMAIEDEFGIEITDDQAETLVCAKDIFNLPQLARIVGEHHA